MAETDLFVNDYPPNTLILQVVHFSNLSSGNPKLDTGGELGTLILSHRRAQFPDGRCLLPEQAGNLPRYAKKRLILRRRAWNSGAPIRQRIKKRTPTGRMNRRAAPERGGGYGTGRQIFFTRPVRTLPGPSSVNSSYPSARILRTSSVKRTGDII